eukprot:Gb_34583 [translate_table: standard]
MLSPVNLQPRAFIHSALQTLAVQPLAMGADASYGDDDTISSGGLEFEFSCRDGKAECLSFKERIRCIDLRSSPVICRLCFPYCVLCSDLCIAKVMRTRFVVLYSTQP